MLHINNAQPRGAPGTGCFKNRLRERIVTTQQKGQCTDHDCQNPAGHNDNGVLIALEPSCFSSPDIIE